MPLVHFCILNTVHIFSCEFIYFQILPVSGEDGEKFICPICNCSLLNLHDLTVHIRSHNSQASGSQTNTCKICGKVLSSQSSLDRHMLVHSGNETFQFSAGLLGFIIKPNPAGFMLLHRKR